MQKLYYILLVGIFAAPFTALQAADYAGDEERVEHYEVSEPQTADQARMTLKEGIGHIEEILQSESLDGNAMEAIHERSYALEAALEVLSEAGAVPETVLEEMTQTTETLHYATEDREEVKTRESFARLQKLVQAFKTF